MEGAAIMRAAVGLLGFLLTVQLSQQAAVQDSRNYYIGAVVEFAPITKIENGTLTLLTNAAKYVEFIQEAKKQNADIIVFPEDGLTSYIMPGKSKMDPWTTAIPSPEDNFVPCTQNRTDVSETLKVLSCAARDNSIYLVVNIAEKEVLKNGTVYHNTNMAFDRQGKIVARYRKVNLYGEDQFSVVEPPEIVTFDTDFGVKFGTFICFDILFATPALDLTRLKGVTDIVYSTAWFSEAPFLTAVQTQYGWSYGENVNMLAAGYNNPRSGSAGSGIYLGEQGIAVATMTEHRQNRLLVAQVPKKSPKTSPQKFTTLPEKGNLENSTESCYTLNMTGDIVNDVFIKRDNIVPFTNVILNEDSFRKTLCHNDFCCEFQGTKSDKSEVKSIYRAVVFNGCRHYGRTEEADIRTCALIQCSNDSVASCGVIKQSDATFDHIHITTTINNYSKMLVIPTTLNSSLLPFTTWSMNKEVVENGTKFTIALNKQTRDVSTFGLYMRPFNKTSGSPKLFESSMIIVLSLVSSLYLAGNRL
ncbi:vanin-like protein 1 [Augochlora pura]